MTQLSKSEVSGYFFSAEDFRQLSATVAKIASVHTLAAPLTQATIDGITKYALQEVAAIVMEAAKYSQGGWPTPAAIQTVVAKDPDLPDLSQFPSIVKELSQHWNFNPDQNYVNPRQRAFASNYRLMHQPGWGPYVRSTMAPPNPAALRMRPPPAAAAAMGVMRPPQVPMQPGMPPGMPQGVVPPPSMNQRPQMPPPSVIQSLRLPK